jgi:hypothetical protein
MRGNPLQCSTYIKNFSCAGEQKDRANGDRDGRGSLAARDRRGLFGGDAVLEIDPVARGYAQ